MIQTIIVSPGEALENRNGYEPIFKEKTHKWIDEAYDKGYIIEILRFDFHIKSTDRNRYCDIEYRSKLDPIHIELIERLKIGL